MSFARITVYINSESARVEVDGSTFPVHISAGGQLSQIPVRVGQQVKKGDLLARLDGSEFQRKRAEHVKEQQALELEVDALRRQRQSFSDALALDGVAGRDSLAKVALQRERTALENRAARRRAEESKVLAERGVLSEEKLRSDRLVADRAALDKREGLQDRRLVRRDLERRIKLREGEISAIDRSIAETEAGLARLRSEIISLDRALELLTIESPVDGVIAHLEPVKPGARLESGALLLMILPESHLHVVAYFHPAQVLGRVRADQSANVRLDGFPWTEYGMIPATVENTELELDPELGLVRVELALRAPERIAIPLQHGQPGIVEIAVEETAPFNLLLRAAGAARRELR